VNGEVLSSHGKGPILVATDLSARCDRPIERAIRLAADWSTDLRVLHVLPPGGGDSDRERAHSAVLRDFPDLREEQLLIEEGVAPDVVAATAGSLRAALVVTGAARYNGLNDFFLGTAVDQVIRRSPVPVLIARQRAHIPYADILMPTDLTAAAHRALRLTLELFPSAAIDLIHAFHVPYEAWLRDEHTRQEVASEERTELDRFLAECALSDADKVRLRPSLMQGETGTVLARTATMQGDTLAVIATRRRSEVEDALFGRGRAKQFLEHLPIDIMIVREDHLAA
jgi:nucleotide-binding universal stress UspA family protein